MTRSEGKPITIYGKPVYKPLLFVVSAPSGAGKTSLCREIARNTPRIHYSVSYTTRDPRPGEQDGIDYRFVSQATFREMAQKNLLSVFSIGDGAQFFTHPPFCNHAARHISCYFNI